MEEAWFQVEQSKYVTLVAFSALVALLSPLISKGTHRTFVISVWMGFAGIGALLLGLALVGLCTEAVLNGQVLAWRFAWLPELGLEVGLRMDGLAWLFTLLVLGIGGLSRSGREHAERYWREVVGATGARRVWIAHWDDFTRPQGEIAPFPRLVDDLGRSVGWLAALAEASAVRLEQLPFAEPVRLAP